MLCFMYILEMTGLQLKGDYASDKECGIISYSSKIQISVHSIFVIVCGCLVIPAMLKLIASQKYYNECRIE